MRVVCCVCGKDCGDAEDWRDETGLPADILHNAHECNDCHVPTPCPHGDKGCQCRQHRRESGHGA